MDYNNHTMTEPDTLPSLMYVDYAQQSPPPPPPPPPPPQLNPPKKRPNKMHVSAACVNCKKAHLACDVSRPCNRCVATDKADTCRDIQHKKRGRPKMMRDANNNKIRPTNNNSTSTATGTSKNNKLMLSTSSDVMTVSSHDVMTILLSMDLCCARVSDKSLEYLELYPQEFSHRSLYDFLIPGESQQTLSRLHRCLLDNAAQHQKSKQPTNYIRSSFEKFFSFSLEPLLNIANGSLTLKQTLKFRYGRDSSKTEEMNCRFYLGGGFGADLFDSHGLDQLYIVCVISPTKTKLSPTLTNTNTTAFNAHILSTTTDHLTSNIPHNMNDMIHLPPLIINNNDSSSTLSSSVSPTTTSLTVLEETEPTKETLEEAENSNNSNKMSSPVMMKRTVSNNNNNTIHLPLISSSPNYENTKNKSLLDRFRYNTQSQSQQFIHPNELYYLKTTSSRLSSEAIARTAYPYLSKASSNTTGSGPLASYNSNLNK